MTTEKERQNREELFKLMRENPDLPVVPMVDSEIVSDDCHSYWMGSWGNSCIGEYIIGSEVVYFRYDDEAETVLNDCVGGIDFYELPEKEVAEKYAALPWIKAIIVYIDLPN